MYIYIFDICLNDFIGLLRLQQIYQGLQPGNETFQVETVKRISNVTQAISFLKTLEETNRWSRKFIVLDCPTAMAKEIVVSHVRDVSLGRRTYHYLLSGLVSIFCVATHIRHSNSYIDYEVVLVASSPPRFLYGHFCNPFFCSYFLPFYQRSGLRLPPNPHPPSTLTQRAQARTQMAAGSFGDLQ